jgi:hypothetical protein
MRLIGVHQPQGSIPIHAGCRVRQGAEALPSLHRTLTLRGRPRRRRHARRSGPGVFDDRAMPPQRKPLPDTLTATYLTSTRLLDVGSTRAIFQSPELEPVSQGIWRKVGGEHGSVDYLRALQSIHPEGVFSHDTAATVWGLWLPAGLTGFTPIHVSKTRQAGGSPCRKGVAGHVLPVHAAVRQRAGLRLTSPAWTWVDLAGTALHFEDLIAAGDSLLQSRHGPAGRREPGLHPLSTMAELEQTVASRRKVKGIRRAREALGLLRAGCDSRPESKIRTRIVDAGLPEPAVNPVIVLARGRPIQPDLAWEDLKICLQYEGDHHRTDKAQWASDIVRDRRMHQEGWVVFRLTSRDLTASGWRAFVAELRAAIRAAGASRMEPRG